MYKLAEIYQILSREFLLEDEQRKLLKMDPSIHIHRYCDKLEFPDRESTEKVRDTAIRFI